MFTSIQMERMSNWNRAKGRAWAQFHQSVVVSHLTSADEPVQQFVNSTSSYLLRSVISGPDAIHQSYGLSQA